MPGGLARLTVGRDDRHDAAAGKLVRPMLAEAALPILVGRAVGGEIDDVLLVRGAGRGPYRMHVFGLVADAAGKKKRQEQREERSHPKSHRCGLIQPRLIEGAQEQGGHNDQI